MLLLLLLLLVLLLEKNDRLSVSSYRCGPEEEKDEAEGKKISILNTAR
jgi:hypothetical protein